jgi:hypothetical protein
MLVRRFNPASWRLEGKEYPREVDVGRLVAIAQRFSVCTQLTQNPISHVAPLFTLLSFRRAGDVKQFASILEPCPTTSRPRHIPAGNIRQRQTDSSPHVSLSKSTSRMWSGRFRRTESNSEAATAASSVLSGSWTQICDENGYAPANTTTSLGRLIRPLRVPVSESHLPTNCLHKESRRAARSTCRDTMLVCYSSQE